MRIKQRRTFVVIGSGSLLFQLEETDHESSAESLPDNPVAISTTVGKQLPESNTTGVQSHVLASDAGIQNRSALSEKMRWDVDGLEVEVHPDGSESINLNGRFTHVSAAIRDENGEMRIQCFSGYTALTDAINGKTPTRVEVKLFK
jgi:hypothetical protein